MARQRDDLDKLYKTKRWKALRVVVLKRDRYRCQECKRRGVVASGNIVHHVVELRDDVSKAFDINNLETVCTSCHNTLHPERNSSSKTIKKKDKVIKFYRNNDFI
ncbi:HNH endonuclease [Listeria seeligeri]|uniref:HNH endonuclease n=1 Tax=Listeria seeligeri TaxID=1640 RepID=UPI0022EA564A|nr:HNH endonuclease signature motif containing protein [Listeria seeligeri]